MIEREIGYRGSKSITGLNVPQAINKPVVVKEQRVDGSYNAAKAALLRCTLMGFERNYQTGILSNYINTQRCFSSLSTQPVINSIDNINPWFITGFTDAEGCFTIFTSKSNNYHSGWEVKVSYQINLHKKDLFLLEQIQNYFGVGSISKQGESTYQYRVQSIKDMVSIIKHFDNYPLLSEKQIDYELIKKAFNIIYNKEHLTQNGLNKVIALKACLKRGLPSDISLAFSDVILIDRPRVNNMDVKIDPYWFAGFSSGEACFYVKIFKSKTKIGEAVLLTFQLTQHLRDEPLIRRLADYLGCGRISKNREGIYLDVTKFSDLTVKVLPLLKNHPILGNKSRDFEDFVKVAELMENKAHLTLTGMDEIRKIKAEMNTGRKLED